MGIDWSTTSVLNFLSLVCNYAKKNLYLQQFFLVAEKIKLDLTNIFQTVLGIFTWENESLKESACQPILGTKAERNWVCVHRLQIIFISNYDGRFSLEDLQSAKIHLCVSTFPWWWWGLLPQMGQYQYMLCCLQAKIDQSNNAIMSRKMWNLFLGGKCSKIQPFQNKEALYELPILQERHRAVRL